MSDSPSSAPSSSPHQPSGSNKGPSEGLKSVRDALGGQIESTTAVETPTERPQNQPATAQRDGGVAQASTGSPPPSAEHTNPEMPLSEDSLKAQIKVAIFQQLHSLRDSAKQFLGGDSKTDAHTMANAIKEERELTNLSAGLAQMPREKLEAIFPKFVSSRHDKAA